MDVRIGRAVRDASCNTWRKESLGEAPARPRWERGSAGNQLVGVSSRSTLLFPWWEGGEDVPLPHLPFGKSAVYA